MLEFSQTEQHKIKETRDARNTRKTKTRYDTLAIER